MTKILSIGSSDGRSQKHRRTQDVFRQASAVVSLAASAGDIDALVVVVVAFVAEVF